MMNLHQLINAIFRPRRTPTLAQLDATKHQPCPPRPCYSKKALQACRVVAKRMRIKPGKGVAQLTRERIKDRKWIVYGYTTAGNIVRL